MFFLLLTLKITHRFSTIFNLEDLINIFKTDSSPGGFEKSPSLSYVMDQFVVTTSL